LINFSDERWLDIRQLSILAPLMLARMQVCKDKGFDGVQPDNLMVYQDSLAETQKITGFPITYNAHTLIWRQIYNFCEKIFFGEIPFI
jgi:hypothetical protein